MKLLNSEVLYEISKMGHFDKICIADSGLPIPQNVKRIDLSVTNNLPSFKSVYEVIVQNFCVQKMYIASEIQQRNEAVLKTMRSQVEKNKITFISHSDLKNLSNECVAVIRTGECSPYANVILEMGVEF